MIEMWIFNLILCFVLDIIKDILIFLASGSIDTNEGKCLYSLTNHCNGCIYNAVLIWTDIPTALQYDVVTIIMTELSFCCMTTFSFGFFTRGIYLFIITNQSAF